MKVLIQSAMIFFGTLMAAAVVALGEPASGDHWSLRSEAAQVQNHLLQTARLWVEIVRPWMGWHE
jgi:hypothetical protein